VLGLEGHESGLPSIPIPMSEVPEAEMVG